jgi:photosystem II stability/assembly factor-like uncharacterized protein
MDFQQTKFTNMKKVFYLFLAMAFLMPSSHLFAQKKKKKDESKDKTETPKYFLDTVSLSGLKWRNIGPAFTSGRIADIAVHPDNRSVYYVATASGGVWKTTNSGTTYQPIFDGQGSYSIGCVTIDPSNPNIIWVGTGENNNQRSVGYGDGIYKSEDGGRSWKHKGLKESEHIGKIIVHPDNSDVIWVAAIGPLWSGGGDRGVYKSIDGGENWEAVLTVDENTGCTDLVMDPRNPDILYAAMYQRRRRQFTYVGGGAGSGMQKSMDGGKTWKKINSGLPSVMGRIGLSISPADPEIIYAMVEAEKGSGFYRTTSRGARWEKRSSYFTRGNYYSEIVAHPTKPDVVFAMDTYMQVSNDGGKTFSSVNENYKHVDNHSMWIDPNDTNYYLVGCDGGIYESFDASKTWHYKDNLPVTQFYKVAVDNSKPFYYVYGGTQDNFSMGGPSRTRNQHGIVNHDWFVTQGGDGFESAIDPDNPNIVYAQYQYGGITRYDKATGERMGIQPKPRDGEDAYRWNWDAPLATSVHKSGRVYYAANKVFRSDDRANTWEVISPDLTRQLDRNTFKVMGRVQSMDAVAKNASTSQYGTIVSFSESPINENLLYAGTDDGLIQITEDGGKNWTKISSFPDVPDQTFVYMLLASQHDENVVYACFNNHRNGDFKPYFYKSSDKGKTWKSMNANLPERGSTYSVAEDHVNKDLLFVGTEFSCFVTVDGGGHWKKLSAGLPTIAVRDIAIQQRENDLVIATFGRGFYVLDDYSPLRRADKETFAKDADIFPIKDALVFVERTPLGLRGNAFQGDAYYSAKNPPVGATFTYFVKDKYKTLKARRQAAEKKLIKEGKDVRYPTYEELKAEREEESSYLEFTIRDNAGSIIRKMKTGLKKGVNRIVWDGRLADYRPVSLRSSSGSIFGNPSTGLRAMPGKYSVSLSQSINGEMKELVPPTNFNLEFLEGTTLPAADKKALADFQAEVGTLQGKFSAMGSQMRDVNNKLRHIRKAVYAMSTPTNDLTSDLKKMEDEMDSISTSMYGDRLKGTLDLPADYSIASRVGSVLGEMWGSTSAPTNTQKEGFRIAKKAFTPILERFNKFVSGDLKSMEDRLNQLGAPYTPGRKIEE